MPGSSRAVARALLRHANAALNTLANPAVRSGRSRVDSNALHARAAVDWLLAANANVPDRAGFSLGYYADEAAWRGAYVETTGYIIPTLYRFARRSTYRREEVLAAVQRSAQWLVNVQFQDGSYGNPTHYVPTVFDTGQVIFGLLAAHKHSAKDGALAAAIRAGQWLVSVQHADGYWERYAYNAQPHAYYSEVSWALLLLWQATGDDAFRRAAQRQLEWVIAGQQPNGFYAHMSFYHDRPPVLHTIAYTIQGVLESGVLLQRPDMIDSAHAAAEALAKLQAEAGLLVAHYDEAWRPRARYRCLTGNAQMAVVWHRLHALTGVELFNHETARTLGFLKARQRVNTTSPQVHGGLFGSDPIWGSYFPFRIPNWGVKFFLDLLLFGGEDL